MTARAYAADCSICAAYRERFHVVLNHADHAQPGGTDCGHAYCRAYRERFGVWPGHPAPPEEPVSETAGASRFADETDEVLRAYLHREITLAEAADRLRRLDVTQVTIRDLPPDETAGD